VRIAAVVTVALAAGIAALPAAAGGTRDGARAAVLDLGDSLSVGTAPYLQARLRGHRIARIHDVGLHASDAAAIVGSARTSLPRVLVVSAGTNDDPRIVSTFQHAVRRVVLAAGRSRCVVWPTIVRPPAVGASYDGLNRALARLAARHPNLVLVPWVRMVERHPSWLAPDGVHVSVQGYRARAAAIAGAIERRCPA